MIGAEAQTQMKWQSYPAYKASGTGWLGEIPEHWNTRALKYAARLNYGDSLPAEVRVKGQVPVFGSNGPVGKHNSANTLAPALVIGRKGSYGKVNFTETACFAIDTTYYIDKRTSLVDLRWLYYVLQTLNLDAFSEDSAVPGLSRDFVYSHRVPSLPHREQRAIATFLDRETARIDTLIAKKERLIELLQEKRTALISHAVTKGLQPDVEMKDSGVEWLGEVPGRWEVVQIRHLFENLDHMRIPISAEERAKMQGEYPYYGASGIIDYVDDYIFNEPLILIAEDGANLLSRSTPLAFVARGKYWVNNHAHILRPLHPPFEYWSHILASVPLEPWVTGAAQPKLTQDNLASIRIPVPHVRERRQIVGYLTDKLRPITTLEDKTKRTVETLYEYRTALISAAVTGKIDVREAS